MKAFIAIICLRGAEWFRAEKRTKRGATGEGEKGDRDVAAWACHAKFWGGATEYEA